MRHIASLRDGDVVKYALVDEETGALTQFAQLQVPDHFDFEASALLGTNLAAVLGLDGGSRPKAVPPKAPQPPKAVAPKVTGRNGKRAKPDPANKVQRYITLDEVLAVIDQYPEGITSKAIGERIWRMTGDGSEETPRWVIRTVENRCASAHYRADQGAEPLPFRTEYRERINQDGSISGLSTKLYLPLVGG